uniref:NADH-ubiquinone oxidoreductase chain 4 n=1 Tax=Gmelinoides fasciatus TaxID=686704 RepID=A0A1L5BW56_9CRUS|nr:NADH dehydrogenase subunit 4 [Gmelinoides fasciatus]APL97191.1 NADH dehydrogenase subunit 4 [Gmelinoides fasciatus]
MLSVISSFLGVVVVSKVWGEVVFLGLVMSGVLLVVSGDSDVYNGSLMGEMDSVSWSLSLLSIWVVTLAVLSSKMVKEGKFMKDSFLKLNMVLLSFLLVSFYVSDLVFFYLGFESCLIPIFLLILGWGYQPERAQAGTYMLFYTLFGSLPLFFLIIYLSGQGLGYMYSYSLNSLNNWVFCFFLVMAFLIKFPMYSVHLWLLKAHVEAPVAGSMILAGVLLKLGGYGLIRMLSIWPSGVSIIGEIFICFSIFGGLVVSVGCIRQTDMKLLIACSSVVHMSMCISGLFIMNDCSYKGVMFVMVGHGLCSSGLFYLANMVYERSGSRSIMINKGLISLMPSVCLGWFIMLCSNMAAPPSLNLLGEILLISSLVNWSLMVVVVVMGLSFFSGVYSVYLFSASQHGVYLSSKMGFNSGVVLEYLIISGHWVPLNLVVLSVVWVV